MIKLRKGGNNICSLSQNIYLLPICIAELQKNTDIFRSEFPMNMYPPAPGMPPPGMNISPQMPVLPPDTYNTPRRQGLLRTSSSAGLFGMDRQMPQSVPQYGNMPYFVPQFYGMPYMPQISPNVKPASAKMASPDTFIKVYKFIIFHNVVVIIWKFDLQPPVQSVPITIIPRSWQGVLATTLCDNVCQRLATGRWFSPGIPVSSTNKTDCHDITEILLKVVLNTLTINLHFIIIYESSRG